MSKAKTIQPSIDVKAMMMMRRDRILVTGAYETVKSNTSSMDDTSANVLEYISY